MSVTNTLAYLASSSAMKENSFITLTPGRRLQRRSGLGLQSLRGRRRDRRRGRRRTEDGRGKTATRARLRQTTRPLRRRRHPCTCIQFKKKTFFLQIRQRGKISESVFSWQAFPAKSNNCEQDQSLTEWSTFQALTSGLASNY